jgi:rhodanese-related sulfurtransferase
MKKIINSSLLLALIVLTTISCKNADQIKARALANTPVEAKEIVKAVPPQNLGTIHKLSVADFKKAIDDKVGILVDVRTSEEFAKGHLEGAVNIDFKKRTFPLHISTIAKDKPVLIYCGSGNRSGKAAIIMQSLGFKNIYDLDHGYKGWSTENMAVTTENNDANKKLQEQLKVEIIKAEAIIGKGHQVDVDEFEKLIKEDKVTLVDVRTAKEFAEGHIKGAINVDWKNGHFAKHALKEITNEKPIAIYCGSGNRGTRTMYAMRALGFTEVYNLDQGVKSWKAAKKSLKTLEVKGDIRHLDVENFNNAILGQKGQLVDVRTPKEHEDSHIPHAIVIDFKNDNFKSEFEKLDKKVPVLIYCRSGGRSGRAMKVLEEMGFTVYNLDKGFNDWKANRMHVKGKNVHAKDGGEEGC